MKSSDLKGFTIIELIVVVTIIGILAALSIVYYNGIQPKARDVAILSDLDVMDGLQTSYGLKNKVAGKAYYSGSGYDNDLGFKPTEGNIIDVVIDGSDYCIRGYNPGATKNSISNAFIKESSDGACSRAELHASDLATGKSSLISIAGISGTTTVGSQLTAGSVNPSTTSVSYKWLSSTSLTGTYDEISSATQSTYTISSNEIGKYIKVSATGSGSFYGTVYSSATAVVTSSFTPVTLAYTGNYQTYIVPAGKTSLTMEAWGAQGGGATGGNGGYVKGILSVTPGETLRVYVGGQGGTATGAFNYGPGGFNGGAVGGSSDVSTTGYGGGGASDVRRGSYALADRIIVGGGGGSMGNLGNTPGTGGAGGQTGGSGGTGSGGGCGSSGGLGGGATQSAAGSGGASGNECGYAGEGGSSGTLGVGGKGGNCWWHGSGSGGGGYYGGGGSGCPGQNGGGGGSSWISPSASSVTYTSGIRAGNGQVIFS